MMNKNGNSHARLVSRVVTPSFFRLLILVEVEFSPRGGGGASETKVVAKHKGRTGGVMQW
jgi:hypothetical protein